MDGVAILIPAYQPDDRLVELVEKLRGDGVRLVVVDDGSTVGREVLDSVRSRVDALPVHETNRGKGAALRTGFAWILDHLPDVQAVVTADADGQHRVEDIRRIASATLEHPGGLVLGVRDFGKDIPFRSLFGNIWTRVLFRLLTGLPIRDTQTGLRGIPRALIGRMLELKGDRYEYEIRMLVDAKRHPEPPLQLPIETIYIDDNRSSHFRPLLDTLSTQYALLSTVLRSALSAGMVAVALTGAGATTNEVRLFDGAEACPSADGTRILFQRDTPAGRRVGIRKLADGTETWIDVRPGHATFATWGVDGEVLYTWGHEPKTAYAAQQDATGFNLWAWKNGARRQLTFGRERDYTPAISPDGKTVFFATTRGVHHGVFKNTVALWSVPNAGGEPKFLADVGGESCGMVSPRVSPDGRLLVWAQVDRFFDTWHLQAARIDSPGRSCSLTPRTFAAYSPAWHPQGVYLAFCGFQAGDPGWGVYLMHAASGAWRRVADGRNPAFSSDGRTLYYDRDGVVYSRALSAEDFPPAVDATVERARVAALEAETIHVRAKVVFQPAQGLSFVMRGASKVHPLTLQLFFRDPETIEFATRRAGDLTYAHLCRHVKFVPGRAYVLTGIRRGNELQLSIDDDAPSVGTFAEGLMPLVEPEKIERGANFKGEIKELRVARGWPVEVPHVISRENLFEK